MAGPPSGSIEASERVYHESELFAGQVLVHGQRQSRARMAIRHREIARPIAEVTQALLAIQRNGVVDLALDCSLQATSQQRVTFLGEHLVGDIAVRDARIARQELEARDAGQRPVVERGILPALL